MKKVLAIISVLTILLISVASCNNTQTPNNNTGTTGQNTTGQNNTGTNNTGTNNTGTNNTGTNNNTGMNNQGNTVTGVVQGISDNSIQVMITNDTAGGQETKTFMVTDQAKSMVQGLNLQKDDTVKIKYNQGTSGQMEILTIEKTNG